MLERTKASLESSQIILKDGYPYIVNPLIDGIPRMDPELLKEVTDRMLQICEFDCDLILAPEAMSLPYVTVISLATGVPFSVIRKRPYGCENEVVIEEVTGYSCNKMYINGLRPGEKIVILDDVISTGGTMRSIVDAVEGQGCEVVDIVVAVDKSEDIENISNHLGHTVKAAVRLSMVDGTPRCNR